METIQYSPIHDTHRHQAPDPAKINVTEEKLTIHPDAVVVRSETGIILSRYKDIIWDIRHYGSLSPIYFDKFNENNIEIVKKILYGLLVFGNSIGDISASSIYEAKTVLIHLEKYAKKINLDIHILLQNKNKLFEYSESLILPSQGANFKQLIQNLQEFDSFIDIKIPIDKERDLLLARKAAEGDKNRKQTPIIPPEIYNNSYIDRWENFKIVERSIKQLSSFIVEYANSWYFARDKRESRNYRTDLSKIITFEDAIKKYDLKYIFDMFNIKHSSQIKNFYTHINVTCAHLISATTGMRKNELKKLTHGCFYNPNTERPALIKGIETKGKKGKHEWVTSIDMGRVVTVLEHIGKALCENINLENKEEIPLFLKKNTYYPNIREKSIVHNRDVISSLESNELYIDKKKIILTQEMMDNFLKKTHTPGRWDDEDKSIKVGNPWVFTWHQYRRTFAFLSVNSGMVTLPSLQRQLAHNFMNISAYYAQGAINVEPIIKGDDLIEEINKMRNEQAAIAMSLNIKSNVRQLKTEMLEWATKINNGDMEIEEHIILHKELVKESKKGNLIMKATSIGYCTKNGPCDSHLTFQFRDCGDCDDALPDKNHILDSLSKTNASIEFLANEGYTQDSIEINTQLLEKTYFENQLDKLGEEE